MDNPLNLAREIYLRSARDKLPESTGNKLTAWGGEFQLSWGNWIGLSWGNFELHSGSGSTEFLVYCRGTIFRPRLPGMLVKNTYAAGNVEKECTDVLAHSLGN